MKMRIIFYLVLVALFGLVGNSFAMDEPPEINTPEEYATIIGRQGTEDPTNTFYGNLAGNTSMSGVANSFFGAYVGRDNTTGDNNIFIGYSAGEFNTTGDRNTFVGSYAGFSNSTGAENTFSGYQAGYKNNSYWNTFNGYQAGYRNTSGYWNTCMGYQAGHNNQTGNYNVFLGAKAGYKETGSHKLYIDSTDTVTPLIWGDFSTNKVVIYGSFRAIANFISSDKRLKKDIKPMESSLDKISNLQGVSYEWKVDEYPDIGLTEGKQIGLVAQDVEQILPELVSEDKDGYKAVSYTKLTAVLVEAVKELKAENQRQKEFIEEQRIQSQKQQAMFEKQQAEIEKLSSMIKALKS